MTNEERRLRLTENELYRLMGQVTTVMDRFYLDALIGLVPGWGDAATVLFAIPFIYFAAVVVRSLPLTLAIINNALWDVLLGMIPFFIGDVIDVFHRSHLRNMRLVQGYVDGDRQAVREVRKGAAAALVTMLLLLLLIALMVWLLIALGEWVFAFWQRPKG